MKYGKRAAALSLCACLLLACVCGCSKEPAASDASAPSSTGTTASAASGLASSPSESVAGEDTTTAGSGGTTSPGGITQTNSSKTNKPTDKTTQPTKAPSKDPYAADLGGRTIVISVIGDASVVNPKKGQSSYADAVADRFSLLQSKLHCKIQVKTSTTWETQNTSAFTAIMSGEEFADILMTPVHQMQAYMSSSLIENLKAIPTMDLSQSYVNAGGIVQASTVGKKTFCVASNDLFSLSTMGVFFNKRMLEELRLTSPYKLVEDNQWTIQKMRDMMKAATKDIDGKNGMTADDQWGLIQIGPYWEGASSVLAANGADLLKSDGKGNIQYNVDSPEVINAINLACQMYVKDKTVLPADDSKANQLFMDGRSLFLCTYSAQASELANMDEDFGFVPFPRGDAASSIRSAVNWNATSLAVLKQKNDQGRNDAGAFLQAFCYASEDTLKVRYKEFNDRYFRDDDSQKMLQKLVSTVYIAPHSFFCSGDVNWTIHTGTVGVVFDGSEGKGDPATLAASTKSATVAELNTWLKKITA